MPLSRREFEAAACRIWSRRNATADDLRQCCEWVYGLGLATLSGSSLDDDAGFLWRLIETRAKMPAYHRLLAGRSGATRLVRTVAGNASGERCAPRTAP